MTTKVAGASRLTSRSRTGPASPRRSVCAPDQMSPHSNADQVKEQIMNLLRSAMSRYFRGSKSSHRRNRTSPQKTRRQRLSLEALEDRSVPATISIANASINESGSPNSFVTAGSGGLSGPEDITIGPDGNLYVVTLSNNVLRYNSST